MGRGDVEGRFFNLPVGCWNVSEMIETLKKELGDFQSKR
jgi:hypothetical protein